MAFCFSKNKMKLKIVGNEEVSIQQALQYLKYNNSCYIVVKSQDAGQFRSIRDLRCNIAKEEKEDFEKKCKKLEAEVKSLKEEVEGLEEKLLKVSQEKEEREGETDLNLNNISICSDSPGN